jgi:hypothetical protein
MYSNATSRMPRREATMSPDRRYSSEGLTACNVPKVEFAATKTVAISASLPISGQTYAELKWMRALGFRITATRWHPQKPEKPVTIDLRDIQTKNCWTVCRHDIIRRVIWKNEGKMIS